MSSSLLDPIKQLFSSPRPLWACEFTARHMIVAGVDSSRKQIAGELCELAAGRRHRRVAVGTESVDSDAVLDITKDAHEGRAGVRGFEISVVIPDDSSRIALPDGGKPCRNRARIAKRSCGGS